MSRETREVYNHHWRRVRKVVLRRDGWECQIRGPECEHRHEGDRCAGEVDHIIPWRKGGALYDPDNLRAACGPCNRSRQFHHTKRRTSREW